MARGAPFGAALLLGMAALAATLDRAAACAHPLFMALMERSVPEIARVKAAEQKAARDGVLRLPVWKPGTWQTQHQWRLHHAKAAVERLVDRIRRRSGPVDAPMTLDLLLVHEFARVSVSTGPAGTKGTWRVFDPNSSTAMLVTSSTVLSALAEGRLSWPAALQRGLVVFRGAAPETDLFRRRLAGVFAQDRSSR